MLEENFAHRTVIHYNLTLSLFSRDFFCSSAIINSFAFLSICFWYFAYQCKNSQYLLVRRSRSFQFLKNGIENLCGVSLGKEAFLWKEQNEKKKVEAINNKFLHKQLISNAINLQEKFDQE